MQPQALIRTYVPILVGSLASWLLSHGIAIDESTQKFLVFGFTGVVIAAYYTLIHLLESRWPVFSVLLGSNATPSYGDKAASAPPTIAKSEATEAPEDLGR